MSVKMLAALVVTGALLVTQPFASASAPAREPDYQSAIVQFHDIVWVMDKLLAPTQTYLIEHNAVRMREGAPCTSIHEFRQGVRGRQVVAFHCRHRDRTHSDKVRVVTQRLPTLTVEYRLVEYQFAGSAAGHAVP